MPVFLPSTDYLEICASNHCYQARTFVFFPETVRTVTPTGYDTSYRQYTSFNCRNYDVPAGHTMYDTSYRQYASFNFRNYDVPAGHIFHLVGSDCKIPVFPSVSVSVICFYSRE